jgi:putative MATE family efflux protein
LQAPKNLEVFKTAISYNEIWKIAYPIILGSIAHNLLNVTDTAFLGRVGEVELGAGAVGGLYYLAIIMLAWGFGIGLQIIVARRNGEGNHTEIGRIIQHGLFFLLPLALLMFLFMQFNTSYILDLMVESDVVAQATEEYIVYRNLGVFVSFINILFRAFFVGIGRTYIIIFTTTLMALVNIFLDYCLIFGNFGFPEMGIAGAAIASVLAEVCAMLLFFIYSYFLFPSRNYQLFNFGRFDFALYLRIIRISIPMMGQHFLSLATWLAFFLFVEKMGEQPLAISNIIRSYYMILLVPMWGFASATNTLVSYLIGAGRSDEVMSLTIKIMVIAIVLVGFMVLLGLIFPAQALMVYTNDPLLIAGSIPLVKVISLAAIGLSVAFIFFSAVSGTGKTQMAFIMEVAVLIIYFVYTWYIVVIYHGSITQVWVAELLYAILLLAFSGIYLRTGRWRKAVV